MEHTIGLCYRNLLFRGPSVYVLVHFTWFNQVALERDSQAQIAGEHPGYT